MQKIPLYRYYLEIISVPVFAWLVVHLSGHGLMLLKYNDHDHQDADHAEHGHGEHGIEALLELLLSVETLGGVLALILFVWLWHQRPLKRFVPCSHDHCHHKSIWPHALASLAFVFHWFPESAVRYEVLNNFSVQDFSQTAAAIGFASHFVVDVLLVYLLGTFWTKAWQRLISSLLMIGLWLVSFWVGENGGLHLEGVTEPIVLLVSAFLLAMFVHKPHKPEPKCKTCTH